MSAYLPALLGGVMIGGSALLMFGLLGRITGISGIFGALLSGGGGHAWRIAFLAGLAAGPALVYALTGSSAPAASSAGPALTVVAGLLVGFGTRLGGGCTSGHGVCGIARLSPRSLVATGVFMAAGFATVFIVRHLLA